MVKKSTYEQEELKAQVSKEPNGLQTKSKASLQASDKRLSQMIHGLSIAAFVIDENHLIIHCNKAFESLTGVSRGDLIGTRRQWMTFYPSQRPTLADVIVDGAAAEEIARYYAGKFRRSALINGAYEVEDFFPTIGQSGKWLFFTAAPLLDEGGKIIGAIETLQDITERKQTEEALRKSERRFRALLDFEPYPIVVFRLDGRVSYLNPAFSETFGWTLEELEGEKIPFVPPGFEEETREALRRLFEEKVLLHYETQRLTKDGRLLDVVIRAALVMESRKGPTTGEIVILRDVTLEKRTARNNEAMRRISMALPEYPDLENLLHYINGEVKSILGAEGAIAVLHDAIKDELFILGAAFDDRDTQERMGELRFSTNQLVSGRVIRSGEPIVLSDTSLDPHLHEERDRRLGHKTRTLVMVPLKSSDRIIGTLGAINKKEGVFGQSDVEMLEMIAGTVALSIENARVSEELKKAYKEVTSLNRAKDKVINHLSHELKTPVSILAGSLNLLTKRLEELPDKNWNSTLERIMRNLDRVLEIQYQVDDIMKEKEGKSYALLSLFLEQCTDEFETLAAEEVGEGPVVERIRRRIEELFGPKEAVSREMSLDETVRERLEALRGSFGHREVEIITRIEPTPPLFMPPEVLQKVIDGLIRNAVENTPDEGKIELGVERKGEGSLLVVHDYGVGIPEEAQRRIFEGFFTTRDTMSYSSKRPYDFNAGGKGADLLRMKIFSERYHFQIEMASRRCPHIPKETDVCPGRISACPSCSTGDDCHRTGGTLFTLYFPPRSYPKA